MKRTALLALAVVMVAAFSIPAQEEVYDRIVAVVERDVIMQSEVDEYAQLQMLQSGTNPETISPEQRQALRCSVLRDMIDERVLVAKAEQDSIQVEPQQVEDALKNQMETLKARFPTDQAYREQLRKEGTTERELRNRLRTQVYRYLLRDKLTQQLGQKITVTFNEVERLYEQHRDSLPVVPASVSFLHITRLARPGDSSLASARLRIAEARRRLAAGESFESVARTLSQDAGSASAGGDVGFFGRGVMVPEFESAAFSLDSGAISAPVLTQYGLHLIQNLGFEGEQVHARHILAAAKPGPSDYAAVRDTMLSLYRRLQKGEDFSELARAYSMDPNVRQTGGHVGPISPDDLPGTFGSVISTLAIGQISEPFETDPGTYHIVKLLARTREHQMNLTDDRKQIEEAVRQQKLLARVEELLDRQRERYYVDIRMPDCAFGASHAGSPR